jgi:hypothetical protein
VVADEAQTYRRRFMNSLIAGLGKAGAGAK